MNKVIIMIGMLLFSLAALAESSQELPEVATKKVVRTEKFTGRVAFDGNISACNFALDRALEKAVLAGFEINQCKLPAFCGGNKIFIMTATVACRQVVNSTKE